MQFFADCESCLSFFDLLEEDDGLLVLVDQHAAHERVRLERLQSGTCTVHVKDICK